MKKAKQELLHFLSDMYSVEKQALTQMKSAPGIAKEERLSLDFSRHYDETKFHVELIEKRLKAKQQKRGLIKDTIMTMGGQGFIFFAKAQLETPGRLLDHAYSYEAMEWAGYQILMGLAKKVDDYQTVEISQTIASQEELMMRRLENRFDAIEELAHKTLSPKKLKYHLRKHLADVHAFECQSEALFNKKRGPLEDLYHHHLLQTKRHANQIKELGYTSKLKDLALSTGGSLWKFFFNLQSDTPAKFAAFTYAVLHLEIGGYELLKRTAVRANDQAISSLCSSIIAEKKEMAKALSESFEKAIESTLS